MRGKSRSGIPLPAGKIEAPAVLSFGSATDAGRLGVRDRGTERPLRRPVDRAREYVDEPELSGHSERWPWFVGHAHPAVGASDARTGSSLKGLDVVRVLTIENLLENQDAGSSCNADHGRGRRLAGPASISECRRERRSAHRPVTVGAPRPNPLPRWTGPTGGATQASGQSRQDAAHFPPSDAAPPSPDHGVGGRELHDRRMSDAAGTPLCVSRTERCPEQTDDERRWKQALAREIHDF
jgi:hypothetical protein